MRGPSSWNARGGVPTSIAWGRPLPDGSEDRRVEGSEVLGLERVEGIRAPRPGWRTSLRVEKDDFTGLFRKEHFEADDTSTPREQVT